MMSKTVTQDLIKSAADSLNLLFIYFLIFITLVFSERVTAGNTPVFPLLLAAVLYTVGIKICGWIRSDSISYLIRVICILGLLSYLFQAVAPLQFVFYDDWFDPILLSVENSLTGTESAYYSQKFVNPILTEWMMFAYVIYVPLLPVVAVLCYRNSGRQGGETYLLNLITVNFLCYVGFIIFPVASPLYYNPELFTVPLEGGFFTWCSEWMRSNQHYPGGSLPSPHSAAATVMLICIYRYARKYFFLILPITFTIYLATVYGRFHYAWDSIAGIMVALLTFRITPAMINGLTMLKVQAIFSRRGTIRATYSNYKNGGIK